MVWGKLGSPGIVNALTVVGLAGREWGNGDERAY